AALFQLARWQLSVALEAQRLDPVDAGDAHGRGHHAAEKDRLGEGEVVRVEEAASTAAQVGGGEEFVQRVKYLAADVTRGDAHHQGDVQRHEVRSVNLQIDSGHAEAFQEGAQVGLEGGVDGQAALAVDGQELGVPAARPAAGGGGPLHLGV